MKIFEYEKEVAFKRLDDKMSSLKKQEAEARKEIIDFIYEQARKVIHNLKGIEIGVGRFYNDGDGSSTVLCDYCKFIGEDWVIDIEYWWVDCEEDEAEAGYSDILKKLNLSFQQIDELNTFVYEACSKIIDPNQAYSSVGYDKYTYIDILKLA